MSTSLRALLLTTLGLTGCSALPDTGHTVYEAAVGANVTKNMPWSQHQDGGFAGPSDMVRLTVRHEFDRAFVGYSHISHLSSGWPVNNERTEDWLDMVEFGVRFDSREF